MNSISSRHFLHVLCNRSLVLSEATVQNSAFSIFTIFNWQLRESQLATHLVKREQAEVEQQYQEKVSQWESSQEALDQLTDELQAPTKGESAKTGQLPKPDRISSGAGGHTQTTGQDTHVHISICKHRHNSHKHTYSTEVVIYPSEQILPLFFFFFFSHLFKNKKPVSFKHSYWLHVFF